MFACNHCKGKHPRPVGRNCSAILTPVATEVPDEARPNVHHGQPIFDAAMGERMIAMMGEVQGAVASLAHHVTNIETVNSEIDSPLAHPTPHAEVDSHPIPSVDVLRDSVSIQTEVDHRLRELQTSQASGNNGESNSNRCFKSGKDRIADSTSKVHITWPH